MGPNKRHSGAIAIIGMAGRFPGANGVGELWRNLCAGVESISNLRDDELEDGAHLRQGDRYVKSRGILKDVDLFDSDAFGFLPREADVTDPQQRVLMECAWEALEDGGYDPARYKGNIGVFAGSSINTYLLLHLASDARFIQEFTSNYQTGSFAELIGNGQDFLATRISYKLNLRGPSVTVQSACSTSLMAVAQACDCLRNGDADMVLAGGVSISFPQKRGYLYQEGGMVSPDGHCRPFDAGANGTVFGSGAGIVLLKRAEEAIADGDRIYAMIIGRGVNNDGSGKMGFAAPSIDRQAAAIARAHETAGITADGIGYVECHGTGTPLGDPIELSALAQAFSRTTDQKQFCAVGSLKSSVGHLDVAAGVTGLIKTAMVLEHETIPPTLHYRSPNPNINFADGPFYVNTKAEHWPRTERVRRAGVSAFGVGGTNVHLVLEEAPVASVQPSRRSSQVLILSAKNAAALRQLKSRIADTLESTADVNLEDAAFTLAVGRREFSQRIAVVASSRAEAALKLRQAEPKSESWPNASLHTGVGFLFPGQGAQYPGMGEELYRIEPTYRAIVDQCSEQLLPALGVDLREMLYPAAKSEDDAARLRSTRFAQPSLFVTEYATARLWMEWGVLPKYFLGHSIGEFVAATLAGVVSLEDALQAVARRAALMQSLPAGAMLAVRMPETGLLPLLDEDVSLAAVNSASLCVASGPLNPIERLERVLTERAIHFKRLHTSHAFHSSMVQPVVAPLADFFARIHLQAPRIPIASSVTGRWLTEQEATSPQYWAGHCRETVRFDRAIATLLEKNPAVLLEVGPGSTLATLSRQAMQLRGTVVVQTSLPGAGENTGAMEAMQAALAGVWGAGIPVDWAGVYSHERLKRTSLPTYPFQRRRHWVEVVHHIDASPETAVSKESYIATTTATPTPLFTGSAMNPMQSSQSAPVLGIESLSVELVTMFEELSGVALLGEMRTANFLELGFDSLFLTQVAQEIRRKYDVKVTFRQMLEQYSSIDALAAFLLPQVPAEKLGAAAPAGIVSTLVEPAEVIATKASRPATANGSPPAAAQLWSNAGGIEAVLQQQLRAFGDLMQQQLQYLSGQTGGIPSAAGPESVEFPAPVSKQIQAPVPVAEPRPVQEQEAFALKASPRFDRPAGRELSAKREMTAEQQVFLESLIKRYCAKTPGSKKYAQQYRGVLADPRSASGFRPEWKEMVYSLVCARSAGSKFWDVDGNQYIDLVNGFGPTMFGHGPKFVIDAVKEQVELSIALGPQTPLAGETAELIAELTGSERVTFCNTGSEAVMAALRVARTVTGRDKVVLFAGDYHGQFDEVLVKGLRRGGEPFSLPIAPGIPRKSVENVTVLEYGTQESLEYLQVHAGEFAAVLVEPVQSRHPELQPKHFLTALREITAEAETALIFDEVVTGFRIHAGGAQAFFGVQADLATYGKVAGGGMPLGVLAGKARFMDALDGGAWQYGDASYPEVGVTFMAGTFVRHPVIMAATNATLRHIRDAGPDLYTEINAKAASFADSVNGLFDRRGVPAKMEHFGSVMYFGLPHDLRFGSLLYFLLRERGIFILEGFPLYLTTEHTDADLQQVVDAMDESILILQRTGLMPGREVSHAGESAPLPSKHEELAAPLTEPQLEILLAAQVSDEANCSFNECFSVHLDGPLEYALLEESWQQVLANHEALRMTLNPSGESMSVHPQLRVPIRRINLKGKQSAQQEEERRRILESEGLTPFDLEAGPLVHATLIEKSTERHELVVTAHHVVCDGWSVNVVLEELAERYSALVAGRAPRLEAAVSFRQYARGLAGVEAQAERAVAEDFWKKEFDSIPEILDLPTDRPRGAVRTYHGSTHFAQFPAELMHAVRRAGASQGCTLFATLMGSWQILLSKLSGSHDIVSLIPAAAQSQLDSGRLVGHCIHLLPVRTTIDSQLTVSDLLRQVKQKVLNAYDHQHYTYGSLVRTLKTPVQAGRLPLSEIQFNLERVGAKANFAGLTAEINANGKRFVNFDLFLNIVESEAGLRLECDFNTDLYDEATISRWLGYYRILLESVAGDINQQLGTISLLSPAERQRLLSGVNQTEHLYPRDLSIPELIARQTELEPDGVAVDFYGTKLSRRQLEEETNQLGAWLRNRGIGAGHLVGIYAERSTEMLIALLGVLKSGAAYVPLDPLYPRERIASILEETEMSVLLTLERHLPELPTDGIPTLCLDHEDWKSDPMQTAAGAAVDADSRAYVIFTSGSTGKPKGVEITHRSVVNLLLAVASEVGVTTQDRLLAVTTLTFDIAALELLLPLVTGATLIVAQRDDAADGTRLLDLLTATRTTILQSTPVTWGMLLEAGFRSKPGFKMLCGGESWTRELANRLLAGGGRLWNMYGPTETTIWSSVNEVRAGEGPITIGPALANTQFYVLDESLSPVPAGVTGELFIGGDGVAQGYYRRPELTAARFMANPFRPEPDSRLYRTGDLVRQYDDGRIQFLRRGDHQIKLRGFRIELEEIERAITDEDTVEQAIVSLKLDKARDPRLVAYVKTKRGVPLASAELRESLLRRLPEYMVPSYFMALDEFPLTTNLKIDRKALPNPEWSTAVRSKDFVPAKTATEKLLAAVWSDVLGIEQIGMSDSLLELGADSLKMFQISARAGRKGLRVSAKQLMKLRTIAAIADELGRSNSAGSPVSDVGPVVRVSRERYRVRNLETDEINSKA